MLTLAFGKSGNASRGRKRVMRWQRGEVSGHDFASEPGVGQQRDHRLGEMPMPVRPKFSSQPLFGSKRSRDGSGALYSADSPTAAPPWKKVRYRVKPESGHV